MILILKLVSVTLGFITLCDLFTCKITFTGVTLKGNQAIDISADQAQIELSPYNRGYFKPGFPYRGMVSLLMFFSPVIYFVVSHGNQSHDSSHKLLLPF